MAWGCVLLGFLAVTLSALLGWQTYQQYSSDTITVDARPAVIQKAEVKALSQVAVTEQLGVDDGTPLSSDEQYLKPYLEHLAEIRDSPVGREFIFLAKLVDMAGSALIDLIFPLLRTITIPINKKVALGHIPIIGDVTLDISSVTLSHLNKIKHLKVPTMNTKSKFTWDLHIGMDELGVELDAKLGIGPLSSGTAAAKITIKDFDLQMSAIVAFEQVRLCEAFGLGMASSMECLLQPFYANKKDGVSGLNITKLDMKFGDIAIDVDYKGVSSSLKEALEKMRLEKAKDTITSNLGGIAKAAAAAGNVALVYYVDSLHEQGKCPVLTVPTNGGWSKVPNASHVCVNNNGGFALEWQFANCPKKTWSKMSGVFPADQQKCMDIKDVVPNVKEGDILRMESHAIAGAHEIADPAFRYVPDSNALGFKCGSGVWYRRSTFTYGCETSSIVPIDTKKAATVGSICVLNQAGIVVSYIAVKGSDGKELGKTGSFPINQQKCIDLKKAGAKDGGKYHVVVKQMGGPKKVMEREVAYAAGETLSVTFQCSGPAISFKCPAIGDKGSPGDFSTGSSIAGLQAETMVTQAVTMVTI